MATTIAAATAATGTGKEGTPGYAPVERVKSGTIGSAAPTIDQTTTCRTPFF
jgi:hypothetical protein